MRLNLSIIAMVICFISPVSAVVLIINGGFESGIVSPGGGYASLQPGSTSINGWVVGGHGIDYIGGLWQASEGNRSLDLSGLSNGSISATINTVPGKNYRLLFDIAGNPQGKPQQKALRVWTGGKYQDFVFNTTGRTQKSMGWETKSLNFTANTYFMPLKFESLTITAYGPALDNVRVVAA